MFLHFWYNRRLLVFGRFMIYINLEPTVLYCDLDIPLPHFEAHEQNQILSCRNKCIAKHCEHILGYQVLLIKITVIYVA